MKNLILILLFLPILSFALDTDSDCTETLVNAYEINDQGKVTLLSAKMRVASSIDCALKNERIVEVYGESRWFVFYTDEKLGEMPVTSRVQDLNNPDCTMEVESIEEIYVDIDGLFFTQTKKLGEMPPATSIAYNIDSTCSLIN